MYKQGEKVPYGKRLIDHLNLIKTKYVLILLDDFFLRRKVNEKKIEEIISWIDKEGKIACFNFESLTHNGIDDKKYDDFVLRPKYGAYKNNLQSAVWNKEILKSLWEESDSPWQWETYGNYRTFNNSISLHFKSHDESPFYYRQDSDCGSVMKKMGCYKTICRCFKAKLTVDIPKGHL